MRLLELAKSLWHMPVSVPPTPKHTDRCYYIPMKDFECFYSHPAPNFLVVTVTREQIYQADMSMPKEKEIKKFDLMGSKVYSVICADAHC